jgi:LmbE family N-acetylglucosaminyl deacetylase
MVKPMTKTILASTRSLAFFAHPDDETILCGGTLALLAQSGVDVVFLSATRGEGGEVGEPPVCTQEELGEVREAEMACAVKALGGMTVDYLDYVDPLIGENDTLHAYTDDLETLTQELKGYIEGLKPAVVLTHGSNGEYGHPAHVVSHQACRAAIERMKGARPALYGVSAAFEGHMKPRVANKDDPADIVIDVSSVLESKLAAALCHRSQNALFVRRASKEAGRQMSVREVLMLTESLHRFLPPADGDVDSVVDALRPYLISMDK